MPMVCTGTVPLLLLSLQRLLQQKLIHRLHVTAAHPPSPSDATGGTAPYTGTGIFTQSVGTVVIPLPMPMVVPEPLPLLFTEPAAITQQKLIHRLHVTAAHPPSPSVQRAAPHHIPAPESLRNQWEQ